MTDETKGDGMTLEQVRDSIKSESEFQRKTKHIVTCTLMDIWAKAIDAHLADQSAMRASAIDGGFAKDLASRQETPSVEDRALIAENLEYLIAPGQSAMRVDEATPPREWVEAAYAAFLRINDDDSDKAKTDLGTWAIGTHAALKSAIGGQHD